MKLTIANGLDIHGKQHFHGGYILYLYGVICLYYFYMVLYAYIIIDLYIYIGIVLFVYCFIACLQYGGITFFISIFYFCPLLRPLFFMIVVADSLSFGFLRCKGMAVLSDTKHQVMPYSAKTFPESFHKCCTFGFSKKLSTELFGVLTLGTTIS